MNLYGLLFLIVSTLISMNVHASTCSKYLTSKESGVTLKFMTYYNNLIDTRKLELTNLKEFVAKCELSKELENPISIEEKRISSRLYIYSVYFQRMLKHPEIQEDIILTWASKKLLEVMEADQQKNEVKKKTKHLFDEMSFLKIKSGEFQSARRAYHHSGEPEIQNIEITYDFIVSQTLVTQGQWVDLVGFNNEKLPGAMNTKWSMSKTNTLGFEPLAPLVGATLWSKMFYANRLSSLEGLPEAYQLDINDFTGKLKEGNLVPKVLFSGKKLLDLTPDPSKSLGYRIMTEAEYSFIASLRGQLPAKSKIADVFPSDHLNYIYSSLFDSVYSTLPLVIDGQDIWGIYGIREGELVFGSNEDVFNISPQFPNLIDPFEPINTHTTLMGSLGSSNSVLKESRSFVEVNRGFNAFRLVRSFGEDE